MLTRKEFVSKCREAAQPRTVFGGAHICRVLRWVHHRERRNHSRVSRGVQKKIWEAEIFKERVEECALIAVNWRSGCCAVSAQPHVAPSGSVMSVIRITTTVAGPRCDAEYGPRAARSVTSLVSLRRLARSGVSCRPHARLRAAVTSTQATHKPRRALNRTRPSAARRIHGLG